MSSLFLVAAWYWISRYNMRFSILILVVMIHQSINYFIRENLVELFDLRIKIEVLRYLFDSLPTHGCLNDVLCAHIDSRHRCIAKGWIDDVGGYLRARREDLPDFDMTLYLDHFDYFH